MSIELSKALGQIDI